MSLPATILRTLVSAWLLVLAARAATLFPMGSDWRLFKGTSAPSANPLESWRLNGFNDDAWALGPAPFHYGETAFNGVGTALPDMQNLYSTVYLRRTFRINDPSIILGLTLRARIDDGFIVWINGRRVATVNAPATDAASTNGAFALTTVEYGTPVDYDLGTPSGYLIAGVNTIAVMVLNATLGSSDLLFDAELLSTERPTAPPGILFVDPNPGVVSNLTSVTVGFTRAVTGVAANQFLLSGIPATGVTGSGSTYTFTFPRPAFGPVTVSWGPLHAITDLSSPPIRFDGGAAGSTWGYELLDTTGPALLQRLPLAGTTLRSFSMVEVLFNRPVTGLDARDLRINGIPATNVTGIGAGPYRFEFPPMAPGNANVSWAPDASIVSDEPVPRPFQGAGWTHVVDPNRPTPAVRINEILTENLSGLRDEDADVEDWIELHNRGTNAVNLAGWSLVHDDDPEEWRFGSVSLQPGGHLVVFASGKDRTGEAAGRRPHTTYKLNPNGGRIRLHGPELPRVAVDTLEYPEQAPDFSYGRVDLTTNSVDRYFASPSPGATNGNSNVTGKTEEVHFSVERGFYASPFRLSLVCTTPGSVVRYTTNGSPPSLLNGFNYTTPILINANRAIRAAAFTPDHLPSRICTHTYLYAQPASRRLLPVLSLVTATNNLYGPSGIMEYNPRNTQNHGVAWERPVSVEWIRPGDNGGFNANAGLRVAGGDYIRSLYNYRSTELPISKYSFRLYFRGEYGDGKLDFPVFPGTAVESFDTIHLRAGMNDHSNPLLKDEFVRLLCSQVGLVACHGTFVHLFLNGVYRGIYNPTERVNEDFLKQYHGGGELWDVIGAQNQLLGGDLTAWNALRTAATRDLTLATNYLNVASRMDLVNFVDYLLPHIWADNDDWPHNNTRAARERVPGSRFRFYPWDAEFAFGSHDVSYDTIANTLSTTSPPWGSADYQALFNALKRSPEFRLLFADRVHRAFFNDGPLTDARIRSAYDGLKAGLAPSISGFNDVITPWINARRRHVTNAFFRAGFLVSSNAPGLNRFGGTVPAGFRLVMTNLAGTIWYTTNGIDPRVPFASTNHAAAIRYGGPMTLDRPLRVLARSLNGTNWSALVDATFTVGHGSVPIRFTEIMYNPPGGEAYEFLELQNTGGVPVDLSGFQLDGVGFRFPEPFPVVPAGARFVLANGLRTNLFTGRYPSVAAAGWFSGSLSNGGERLELLDRAGRVVTSVDYGDSVRWPRKADGGGASLENVRPDADPDNPAQWQDGPSGGTPGQPNSAPPVVAVRLNEIHANGSADWIELRNSGASSANLSGWSLTDDTDPRRFVFPSGTLLAPGTHLVVHSASSTNSGPYRAPIQLDRSGETLVLFDAATNRVDVVRYGIVPIGFSFGRGGNLDWTLCEPTPGSANEPVTAFGPASAVAINELESNSGDGNDWIELHNTSALPVGIEGWSVVNTNGIAPVGSPMFIGPGGFLVLKADGEPGPDHLDLRLPATGGFVTLLDARAGEVTRITYPNQIAETAYARIPDGTGAFQSLSFSATPGASNRVADLGRVARFSEFLARGTTDWIELENASTNPLPLGPLVLEVNPPDLPPLLAALGGTRILAPSERIVIHCGSLPQGLVPGPGVLLFPIPLPDDGAVVSLFDAAGRILDRVEYGPQVPGRSLIRIQPNWWLSATNTPGTANSVVADMAGGSQIRINEWLASAGGTNEFVELHNAETLPVNISRWALTDDPSIQGATNRILPPQSFIPGSGFARFRLEDTGPDVPGAPLKFRLSALGETIRLFTATGGVVDTVDFLVQEPWVSEGRFPDGSTNIMRFPDAMTPGAPNRGRPVDLDGDGIPDAWETQNGFRPDFAGDAALDADGDGLSNLHEYLAGTDPRNAASGLRAGFTTSPSGLLTLRFQAAAGRSYSVLQATSPTGTWSRLSDVAEGEGREISVPIQMFQAGTRFYRIVTPVQP